MSGEASIEGDQKTASSTGNNTAQDSIVLEEEIDPDYVPTEGEIVEYAKWLGMDLEKDKDLFWVAKEGLMAPLPKNWKPCKTKQTEDIYYFNFATGESTWDHPCDGYYKRLFEEAKKKKEMAMKESSDQNRTQAKADVEKLTGKADKKKKKKTDKDSLISSLSQKSATGSSGNALGKAPLAPIGGGALKIEKKPLPGITAAGGLILGPKRSQSPPKTIVADNLRKSEVSLLTSSFDSSGGSAKAEVDKIHLSVEPISTVLVESVMPSESDARSTSGTSANTTGTKRSKISSRLAAVVSDSGENQLPSPVKEKTPTKSDVVVGISAKAESKEESKEEPSVSLQQQQHKSSVSDQTTFHTSARPQDVEAKELLTETSTEFENYKTRTISEISILTVALRKAEDSLYHKKTQCDRLSSELAEIERSLSREKQNQSMAEQTESALLRQARDAKDQLCVVQSRNESLQKENDEYRIKIKELTSTRSNDEADVAAGDETIAALREQIKIQEASLQRSTELQNSMREELANQSSFYEAKIRSTMKTSADATEDLARLQIKLDKAAADSEKSSKYIKDNMGKMIEESQKEVLDLKTQVRKEKDAALAAQSARDEANSNMDALKLQITTSKYDVERSEQMMKVWETDAMDKEKKLAISRAKHLELEEENQKLALENKRLQSRAWEQQTTSGEDYQQARANAETDKARLTKDKADLESQLSEQKDECASLRRRLKDALASDSVPSSKSDCESASASASASIGENQGEEVATLQAKVSSLETSVSRITGEKSEAMQRSALLEEQLALSKVEVTAIKEMLTKLQATRDSALESTRDEMQKNVSTLEAELHKAMKSSVTSKSDKELLQIKVDSLNREMESSSLQYAKLTEEVHHLSKEVMNRDSRIREQEISIRDAKLSDDMRVRTVQNLEQENSSHRAMILGQQEEIGRLNKALTEAHAQKTSPMPTVAHSPGKNTAIYQQNSVSQGMMDLGVLMGKQQANADLLESRLKEADTLLTKIHENSARVQNTGPTTIPRRSKADHIDDTDVSKANEILESLGTDRESPSDARASEDNIEKSKLLMEMLTEFAKRRQPLTENSAMKVNLPHWTELLSKEIKFVTEARKALRDEKVAIKWEQQLLLNRREIWKKQKHTRSGGSMQILNQQTSQLNEAVERVRKTNTWLNAREEKLQKFQALLRSAAKGEPTVTLEIELLAKEIDNDTLEIGLVHPFGVSLASVQVAQFKATDIDVDTMPSHLSSDGARVAYTHFPPELRSETNNYLAAQENRRPAALNVPSSDSSGSEFNNPKPLYPVQTSVFSSVARERVEGESTYRDHANWLDSIRVQIDGFNPRNLAESGEMVIDDGGEGLGGDLGAEVFEL